MAQGVAPDRGSATDGVDDLTILAVDDESALLTMLQRKLGKRRRVLTAERADEALAIIAREEIGVLLVDQSLSTSMMQGDELLARVHESSPDTVKILVSGLAEHDDVRRAINTGHIYAYLRKPWRDVELRETVERAATLYRLGRDNRRLMAELEGLNAVLEERVRAATAELASKNELLESLMESLEEKNRLLSELAVTDELTGLYNRRYVRTRLESELERNTRYGVPVACLLIDIDDFKVVNDTWGHPVGDQVLIAVGDVLRAAVRRTDVAGRYGGEELVVVCPSTSVEGAVVLAERTRMAIADIAIEVPAGGPVRITASIGVSATPKVSGPIEAFVGGADVALYDAKRSGKNRVIVAGARAGE